MINPCTEQGMILNIWKTAFITPLPKEPVSVSFGHLRSISIVSTMRKILEKFVEQQLGGNVDSCRVLPDIKPRFYPFHCFATAMLKVYNWHC